MPHWNSLMKKTTFKILTVAALFTLSSKLVAQNDAAALLRSGKEDASKLLGAYMRPITKGLASGVNDAWYSTAKPLGTLGFDLRLGGGLSFVSDDAKSFDLSTIGLNKDLSKGAVIVPANGNNIIPTVVGSGKSNDLIVNVNDPLNPGSPYQVDKISAIGGLDLPVTFGASPFIQLSVGVVKGTEVMLRLIPIQTGDFSSSGYGFGVKHSISQWIWGVDKLPIDIAGIYTYTNNELEYKFGDKFLNSNGSAGSLSAAEYKNSQKMRVSTKAWQLGLIVSKKLAFFTPYASLVLNNATSELAMLGFYPVQLARQNGGTIENYTENVKDPVNSSVSLNSMRSAFGFRNKFGPIAFAFEYNLAYSKDQFSTFNFNLAVNIQQILPLFKL